MNFMQDNPKLEDFVDDDIIDNSQPISLPSSQNSDLVRDEENIIRNEALIIRPPKYTGQQGEFRCTDEIDPKYRHIFTYPYFNLVQSRVIEDALYSDKSMVVCAPTGSGKTVLFEMAITQLLMDMEDKKYTEDFKIIYMAPVKALCTERLTEWYPKFTKLGILCIEVTGDTDVDFPQLKPYRIIITTPEKWDMLTRRWRDHRGLVEVVKLFLIDEVHILNDETRGPVLEAVVSRMKTIESSVQSAHRIEQLQRQYRNNEQDKGKPNITTPGPRIRFIAVSATVNNPEDVAAWLGTAKHPAVYYKFGDECRPVKLKRVVEGYPCSEGTSIFKFDIILNYKLWPLIQKYHNGKPTLIFCNTRKSVALTAETLSREITVSFNPEQKAKLIALSSTLKNKKLQSLILNGVGCHHAGLLYEERLNIEQAFRNRCLPILITTTTLAMGVNLPAHLVIIKNTQQYVNGSYQEYSISTILQMVGRAGRPQFDTEATAVIMTRITEKARYQALVEGTEPLQSFLHKRLAENLNSEAALGTVTDVAQCVQWLNSTFLSVRAVKDPKRYLGLSPAAPTNQISKKVEELCVKAMNCLASAGLITMDEASCIESTEAGTLMSVYYIDLETMKLIMKIEGSETLDRLLWLICESHELSDMHLRVDERRSLNTLNRNNTAATIRFPMKGKISTRQMKLNCVIQAILGCLPIPDPSLHQEAMKIMRIADRVCKCLIAYTTRPTAICQQPKTFSAVLNSVILTKCITAQLWENSPYVSKQLKGIGPTFSMLLASSGKVNFMLLEESHPRDLERIMNKGPPAGNIIRKQISLLPKYQLTITPIDRDRINIQLSLLNLAHLSENMDNLTAGLNHKSYIIVGDSENYLLYLSSFKDIDLIRIYDGCITREVTRKHNHEHKILVHCISSKIVGIDVNSEYLFIDTSPVCHKFPENINTNETVSETGHQAQVQTNNRKRKVNKNDTCKEKIKRENSILDKFKHIKESFGKTSRALIGTLNKTTEISNKIAEDLTNRKSSINISETFKPVMSNDTGIQNSSIDIISEKQIEEDNMYDDLEDEEINNILNGIENEIGTNVKQQNVSLSKDQNLSYLSKINNLNCSKPPNQTRKLYKKNVETNYNFIHLIEKTNEDNDANNDVLSQDYVGGFANSVKFEIDKYLQNTKNMKFSNPDVKALLEIENKNVIDSKLPNEKLLKESLVNTIDLVKNTSGIQNKDKEPISTEHIPEESKQNENININEASKQNENIEQNKNNLTAAEYNQNLNSNKINSIYQGPCNNSINIVDCNIVANRKVISNYRESKFHSKSLTKDSLINENMTYATGTLHLKGTGERESDSCDTNIGVSDKSVEVISQPSCSLMPQYDDAMDMLSLQNTDENWVNTSTYKTYNASNITYKDLKLYTPSVLDSFNMNQENINCAENYSFQAKKVAICTKNNTNHTIKIITKLKIDVDVTKIVSSNVKNSNTDKESDKHSEASDINVQIDPVVDNNRDHFNFQPEILNEYIKNNEKASDINVQIDPVVDNNRDHFNFQPEILNEYIKNNENENTNIADIEVNTDSPALQELEFLNKEAKQQSTPKNSKTVKDIVNKYNEILKRKPGNTLVPAIKQFNNINTPKPLVEKSKRLYKISDIQKLDVPLPKIFLPDNKLSNLSYQVTETDQNHVSSVDNNFTQKTSASEMYKDVTECTLPISTSIEINSPGEINIDLSPECKKLLNSELTDEEFHLHNALLDPKALLHYSVSNECDKESPIPPPPEFADVIDSPIYMHSQNVYTPISPEINFNTKLETRNDKNISVDSERYPKSVFKCFSQDKSSTHSTEVETWTLSHRDNIETNLMRKPIKSYTVTRNSPSSSNPYSNNPTRTNTLSDFKFTPKNNYLKIKK